MNLKVNNRNTGWGIVLITIGIIALANNFGLPDWYQVPVLGVAGFLALVFYIRDRSDWVTLIPVYILWAGAAVAAVALTGLIKDQYLAIAVLPIIALPFLFVYFRDKMNWWALIPSYILLFITLVIFLTEIMGLGDEWAALVFMPGFAVPFLYVYLRNTQRWWALIPSYFFLLIGLIIALDEFFMVGEKFIAPGILYGIGLPFLVVYFRKRENWWALIPAYVLLALGTMIGLLVFKLLSGLAIPAYILLAIAIPFFYVYLRDQGKRWALIPGGITALVGLGFMLGTNFGRYLIPGFLVLLGIWLVVRVIRN